MLYSRGRYLFVLPALYVWRQVHIYICVHLRVSMTNLNGILLQCRGSYILFPFDVDVGGRTSGYLF